MSHDDLSSSTLADGTAMQMPLVYDAAPSTQRLGETLVALDLISPDMLTLALGEQKRTHKMLGETLVSLGLITQDDLVPLLAARADMPTFDARRFAVHSDVTRHVPKSVLRALRCAPFFRQEDRIFIAMADPYDVLALDALRPHLPSDVWLQPCAATDADVWRIVDDAFRDDDAVAHSIARLDVQPTTGMMAEESLDAHPVVQMVDQVLEEAARLGASDIHCEPESRYVRLRYRIDGVLQQMHLIHGTHWPALAQRIKVMAGMSLAQSMAPHDGHFSFTHAGQSIDVRVALMPTVCGETIVLRLLDRRRMVLPLDHLGFSAVHRDVLRRMLKRPAGLILLTGPTGSGKTTTIYAMLRAISGMGLNVVTLEDPVECHTPLLRQTNVRAQHLDFAEGVRALLRQDPDVMFIGEIRDADTARMAMRAAMTGHRVLSTLHTHDAFGVLPRLIDLGVSPAMMAGHITGIIAQRLVRRLCTACRALAPLPDSLARLMRRHDIHHPAETMGMAEGCDACRTTGYRGRTVLAEVLRMTPRLDAMIAETARDRLPTRDVFLDAAAEAGFRSILTDGLQKLSEGIIDWPTLTDALDMDDGLDDEASMMVSQRGAEDSF